MARRRKHIDDLDEEEVEAPSRRARRPRQRWRFVLFLLGIIALIASAPSIVAKSLLRNALLNRALPSGAGRLTAADAAFSWSGGQGLAGVALVDANGAPIFRADLVTLNRSLIGL